MKGRKLLAAALLAGMVSSPVVMAEVLSDDALGEVSAQGLQIAVQTSGAANQNVNNDSAQLNDFSQSQAQGMAVTNSAASAVNVGQNVAGVVGGSERGAISQANDQYAENSENSRQYTYQEDVDWAILALPGLFVDAQNKNNGSTQLNGAAQAVVQGMAVTNAAGSAVNAAQNVAGLDGSDATTAAADIRQRNTQVAQNTGFNVQGGGQIDVDVSIVSITGDFDRQNINNGSTQVNGFAQVAAQAMALTNAASSAANVAQNVVGAINNSAYDDISQVNDQYAANDRINAQFAYEGEGDAVVGAISIDLDRQNINNGSVQLNGAAQAFARGMALTNAASSAANVAQNVAGIMTASLTGAQSDIYQSNNQVALSAAENYQGSVALDLDIEFLATSATVDLDEQNTNNGSVQLNDNAQANAQGMAITNVASSALNVGQNVVGVINAEGGNIRQVNNQYAEDASINEQESYAINLDDATITINLGDVHTNNGSVQLNDNAQANAQGMAITNAANAAVNVGQNVVGMVNGYTGTISQTNVQSAVNY